MIIDAHAHLVTPPSLFALRTVMQSANGQHTKEWYVKKWLNQDEVVQAAKKCITLMDQVGTDMQFLSPRPFALMHSHHSFKDILAWIEIQNDLIDRTIKMYPKRFRGVCGLPQMDGQPVERALPELERCINTMGFIGALVNPDPSEGRGTSPRLSDPYWYPLWEKLCELDVPAHIHSAGCCGRETYDEHFSSEESLAITAIAHSEVFGQFPKLKVMISHGGGSIPYQIGRWRSQHFGEQAAYKPHIADYFKALEAAGWAGKELPQPPADLETFDDVLKRFYFDTDIHSKPSLELLLKTVGVERCLFGTERPGSGGGIDLATGRPMDDFKYTIDRIEFLSDADRKRIYEDNARVVFPRFKD
jgi:4-oxalmesaconate hydratase